jgi:hypothetical protein
MSHRYQYLYIPERRVFSVIAMVDEMSYKGWMSPIFGNLRIVNFGQS